MSIYLNLSNYAATVVVTSDTCCQDTNKDISGDYVFKSLKEMTFGKVSKYIVPDDKGTIIARVKSAADEPNNILLITVGGTGLCPRDVTPEATSVLYDKNCPGIATALILEGLKRFPNAALSRLTAGVYGNCLIVNFPGGATACVECFSCLSQFLGHALEQVAGELKAVAKTHKKLFPNQPAHAAAAAAATHQTSNALAASRDCYTIRSLNSCCSVPVKSLDKLKAPISPPPRGKKSAIIKTPDGKVLDLDGHTMPPINLPNVKTLHNVSQYPLIEYEKALEIMGALAYTVCQVEESIKLDSSESVDEVLGNILAQDVQSKLSIPPFPVSTMDGYALNVPETPQGGDASLSGVIESKLLNNLDEFRKFQADPEQSSSYFCYQVNTGGRVPEKNFAVVPVENTAKIATDSITMAKVEPNRHVREPGSDLSERDCLRAGTVIGPVELSLLLSMGCKELNVVKRPTIGILTTGDELVEFYQHDQHNPNKVVNTNGPLLTALFKQRGFNVINFGTAEDNPRNILLKIHTGLKESDTLVITGGASMGSRDHVKDIVEQIGGIIHFGRVNIKPGKPAAMASIMIGDKRKFIFCLPGNPVSAYITSLVLVLPFIEHGIRNHLGSDLPLTIEAVGDMINVEISQIVDSDTGSYEFDGRLEFARARLSRKLSDDPNKSHLAEVSIKQQSSRLMNLKDCDCLILIDPSKKGSKFLVGQTYPALRLRL